ncbi:hypothetical protein Tco_0568752 [Tanacetum coccineum]
MDGGRTQRGVVVWWEGGVGHESRSLCRRREWSVLDIKLKWGVEGGDLYGDESDVLGDLALQRMERIYNLDGCKHLHGETIDIIYSEDWEFIMDTRIGDCVGDLRLTHIGGGLGSDVGINIASVQGGKSGREQLFVVRGLLRRCMVYKCEGVECGDNLTRRIRYDRESRCRVLDAVCESVLLKFRVGRVGRGMGLWRTKRQRMRMNGTERERQGHLYFGRRSRGERERMGEITEATAINLIVESWMELKYDEAGYCLDVMEWHDENEQHAETSRRWSNIQFRVIWTSESTNTYNQNSGDEGRSGAADGGIVYWVT